MSVTIDIDHFQNWSEIFLEIKRQRNLKVFTAIQSGNTNCNVHRQERKPRSLSMTEPRRTQYDKLRGQASERIHNHNGSTVQRKACLACTPCPTTENSTLQRKTIDNKHSTLEVQPRKRINSTPRPSPTIDNDKLMEDCRLTDAARKLSKEQMALLYEDIIKPLDVYFIFRERGKQSESGDPSVQ